MSEGKLGIVDMAAPFVGVVKPAEPAAPLKLDFGCGKNKRDGFHGVDAIKFDGVDTVADLRMKWLWGDATVVEAHASHFLEHLTGPERVHFFNRHSRPRAR